MTLIERLELTGEVHKGTDLGRLLQWAALHIKSQNEALDEAIKEAAAESDERIRLERALYDLRASAEVMQKKILEAMPVLVDFSKDHAPHINAMAFHGVAPYAKKSRKKP